MLDRSYQPHTADGLADLRAARERFLADREVPVGFPDWLAAAWRRTLFHAVDIERHQVRAARTPPRPRPALLAAARPVLAHLGETLSGLGVGVVLSDARGRIIDCWADEHIQRHLEAIDTRPGADLAEDSTGINALNHVISTGRPALVTGPQHLFGLYQDTSCAGAPVRDPVTGKVEAAVALVSEIDAAAGLLESLASTATDSIQRELLHQASARERHLFEAYLAARGSGAPVAALDGRTRLVSDAAAALLRPQDLDLLEAHAAEFIMGSTRAVPEVTLDDGGLQAAFHAVPGADGDAGVLVRLTPHATGRPSAARSSPTLLRDAGLVGGAADWATLERAAGRAARASGVLLVHGERGTGKSAVASVVIEHGAGGARPRTLDVCQHADHGVVRALREIDGEAALIVRHGERLPADLIHPTADVLRARSGRTAVTLVTASECDDSLSQWRTATATTSELAVPPLRDRGADVAALVDHVAATTGLRLAQDARDALRRYTWPGNVAELEHLMAALGQPAATGGGSTAVVSMADLPPHVLSPQRHLTEMERAERDAVVAALAATGGNKKRAASRLGVSRATLYRKMRTLRIDGVR